MTARGSRAELVAERDRLHDLIDFDDDLTPQERDRLGRKASELGGRIRMATDELEGEAP